MNIKEQIEKYISKLENIIKKLSFVFLFFGGLLFYIYYLEIKYLPELNLLDSVQLLIYASVTGLILLFSSIIMLIIPGLFWQNSVGSSFDRLNTWSGNKFKNITWFILPIISIYISLISVAYVANEPYDLRLIFKILIIIAINLIWVGLFSYRVHKLVNIPLSKQELYVKCAEFFFLSYLNSIISMLPLIPAIVFLQKYRQDNSSLILGVFIILVVIMSNLLVITKPNNINSIYWYPTLGLTTLLIVFLFTGQIAIFPKAIMSTYKLGNINPTSVIIDKQECIYVNKILKFHGVKRKSKGDNKKETKDNDQKDYFKIEDDSCIISNMNILSRIGKESYVEIYDLKAYKENGKEEKIEKINIRFPIPSSSIKKWIITK